MQPAPGPQQPAVGTLTDQAATLQLLSRSAGATKVVAFCLVLLCTLAGFAVLKYEDEYIGVLVPFTFAFFLANILEPIQGIVIRLGLGAAGRCADGAAACRRLRLRKGKGGAEDGTEAEREPLTGGAARHIQQADDAAAAQPASACGRAAALGALYLLRLVAALVCAAVFFGIFTLLIAGTVKGIDAIIDKYRDDHWKEHANQTLHNIMRRLNQVGPSF